MGCDSRARLPRHLRCGVGADGLGELAGSKASPLNCDPKLLTPDPYFQYYRNMPSAPSKSANSGRVARYADMLSAMGTEPRLRIMQLLLSAHPDGLVVSDIQSELEIPNSTLSHHLEKLKIEDLVTVRREGTFLWYTANADVLQELLSFLYAECCTRNKAVRSEKIISP